MHWILDWCSWKKTRFTVNGVAIEVKATKSGDPNVIKISSMEQLEQVTPKLYLTHLHINDAVISSLAWRIYMRHAKLI